MANGERLRDAAADAVTDDARALDAQLVEQLDDALGVRAHVDGARERTIAAPVAEQVEHDEAMPGGHERNDVVPQMARGRKSVDEHDRIAGAARSGGVVVEARAGEIEELTAHARQPDRIGAEDACGASMLETRSKCNAGRHDVTARVRDGRVLTIGEA